MSSGLAFATELVTLFVIVLLFGFAAGLAAFVFAALVAYNRQALR